MKSKSPSPAAPKVKIPELTSYSWSFAGSNDIVGEGFTNHEDLLSNIKSELSLGESAIIWKLVPIETVTSDIKIQKI